jgi:hypothetical protein
MINDNNVHLTSVNNDNNNNNNNLDLTSVINNNSVHPASVNSSGGARGGLGWAQPTRKDVEPTLKIF